MADLVAAADIVDQQSDQLPEDPDMDMDMDLF